MARSSLSFEFVCERLDTWKRLAEESSSGQNELILHTVSDIPPDVEYEKAQLYLNTRWFGSSNKAYAACKKGYVTVNATKIYSTRKLRNGDRIEIRMPPIEILDDTEAERKTEKKLRDRMRLMNYTNSLLNISQNPPLHVIYEDNDLAVVFKPNGIHSLQWLGTSKKGLFALDDVLPLIINPPSPASKSADIASADLVQDGTLERPLPCHRLDARVAGAMLVAKTQRTLSHINRQFKDRSVRKEYRAVLAGCIDPGMLDKDDTMSIRYSHLQQYHYNH